MHTLSVERLYSKGQVKRAGQLLGGTVHRTPEVEDAFRALHNWRLHHAYPMVRERAKLTRLVKPLGGLTAGRLKRTFSIRKKLFRGSTRLDQMQDLVGCRAIVKDMDDLKEVLSKYKSIEEGGRVKRTTDYISAPKASGYRSVHLVLKFDERGTGEKHLGCNVEIQLRTQLQHIWATTVEAAGSMRNEDLKAGEGSREWLRFFTLMSGHIAEIENQPRGVNLQMRYHELRRELLELADSLNVKQNLETFSEFMHEAEVRSGSYGSIYMLKMDALTGDVSVTPDWRAMFAYEDLDDDINETKQSIEVSVDNMSALRQAYPNYFADTRQFLKILRDIEGPGSSPAKNAIDRLDLSFLPKPPPPAKEKVLYLEYTGIVYWGDKRIGRWEEGPYGACYFDPDTKEYEAFEAENMGDFKDDLKSLLSTCE